MEVLPGGAQAIRPRPCRQECGPTSETVGAEPRARGGKAWWVLIPILRGEVPLLHPSGGSERLSDLPGGARQSRVLGRARFSRPSRRPGGSAPCAYEGRQGASLHPVLNVSSDNHVPHASPSVSRAANHSTHLVIPHSRCCSYYRHFLVESTES